MMSTFREDRAPRGLPSNSDSVRRPARLVAVVAVLLVGLGVLDASTSFLRYRWSGDFAPGWGYMLFEAVPWLAWLPLAPLAVLLVRRIRPAELGHARSVAIHGTVAAAAAALHSVVAASGRLLTGPDPAYASFSAQFEWLFPELMPLNMAVYAAVVVSFYASQEQGAGKPEGSVERALTRLTVRDGERILFVSADEVDWLEADGNYVRVHAGEAVHRMRATLSGTLERLDPERFVRVHRSRVVNVGRIREVQPWFGSTYLAILDNGDHVGVSRNFRKNLLEA